MKNEKGMSHITLIIVIILIAFLIFASIYFIRILNQKGKIAYFETNMLQIQGKVKILSEEDNMDKDTNKLKGRKIEENKDIEKVRQLINDGIISEEEEKFSRYYIIDNFDLEQMKLDNIYLDNGFYIVNYDTEEVIYSEGIEVDGDKYYKLSQLKELDKKDKTEPSNEIVNETTEEEVEETSQETQE